MILAALDGASKDEILSPDLYQGSLVLEVAEIFAGSYKVKNPPAIVGSGYVVRSLEAALWAFYRSSSFERGALLAANLGNDADTTAAVFGQLGGAFYGVNAIPEKWLQKLSMANSSSEWLTICSRSLKTSRPLRKEGYPHPDSLKIRLVQRGRRSGTRRSDLIRVRYKADISTFSIAT